MPLKRINTLDLASYRNGAVIHGKTNIAVFDGSMSTEMAVELIINVFGDRANVLAVAVLEEVRRQRLAEKAQNKAII